jgi:hypothetical protein
MAWAEPQHTRGKVDAAGAYLAALDFSALDLTDMAVVDEFNGAIGIIDNWRSSHAYPLQVLKMTL